jgi:hypothetical protein
MMCIVRSSGAPPAAAGLQVKLARATPATVKDAAGKTDFFCLGEAAAIAALREAGSEVVELRDGYYEDGQGGGVAIWGQGRYWEIRSEPLTVVEACGPGGQSEAGPQEGEHVNVRGAIFGV